MPTGTDFDYRCTGCSREFSTQNVLGLVMQGFMVSLILAVTSAFFFGASTAGWKWGGTGVSLAIAGLLGTQLVKHIVNRFKNPPRVLSLRAG